MRRGDGTDEPAEGDPHIWHDPQNATVMVADSSDALDAVIRMKIDTVPVADRKLVTNQDAFGYYLQRYGLQYVGSVVPSFDTSAALSGNQINALVARIRATGTRAVFSESSLPPAAAEALGTILVVAVIVAPAAAPGCGPTACCR